MLLLAWFSKNPATFGQHFPEIGWDSAKTKGTVLLSILPRSCRTQWLKLMIKILPLAQPAAHTPPAPVREATQKTQRKRSPSSAARSEAHAASRCRRARSTAVHGGAELAVAALAGASGVNHGDMLRDFGQRGGLTLRRSPVMRSMHLREQAGAGQGLSSESLHTPRVWPQAGWAAACLAQRLITVGC